MANLDRVGVGQLPISGNDYPFIGDSNLANLTILDLQIQFSSDLYRLPFRLTQANNVGGANVSAEPELTIVDADSRTVFATGSADYLDYTVWPSGYSIHRWALDRQQLVVVLDTTHYAEVPDVLQPNAVLDPRTANVVKNDVRRIAVYNQGDAAPLLTVDDTSLLSIKEGYNFKIDAEESVRDFSGDRKGAALTVNAIGGEGLGWAQDCGSDDDKLLRTLNLASAEAGSMLLSDGECLRVQPQLAWEGNVPSIVPGAIRVSDDCLPCCDCDDYLRVNKAISRIDRDNVNTSEELQLTRDKLISLAEEITVDPNYATSNMRSTAKRNGDCGVNVIGTVINDTDEQWDSVDLVFKFFNTTSGGAIPIWPKDMPPRAQRLSRLVDVGNTPIIRTDQNEATINVGCVYPGETKSAGFGFNLYYSGEWKVCVHKKDEPDVAACSCGWVSCTHNGLIVF